MRGLRSEELESLLDFCYFGEASVLQTNLDSFMVLAEELQILGLANDSDNKQQKSNAVGEEESYSAPNIVVVGLAETESVSSLAQAQHLERLKSFSDFQTLSPPKFKSPVKEDDVSNRTLCVKIPKTEGNSEDLKTVLKMESDKFTNTDLEELNRMIDSMITKTANIYFGSNGSKSHKSTGRKRAWRCNVCGKEGPKNHIAGPIEELHHLTLHYISGELL